MLDAALYVFDAPTPVALIPGPIQGLNSEAKLKGEVRRPSKDDQRCSVRKELACTFKTLQNFKRHPSHNVADTGMMPGYLRFPHRVPRNKCA
jgi:hypothetical protein